MYALQQALEALDVPIQEHASKEDEIFICCPFCELNGETADTRFRLGINLQSLKANCFNCHWRSGGDNAVRVREHTISELRKVFPLLSFDEEDLEPVKLKKKKPAKLVTIALPAEFEKIEYLDLSIDDPIEKEAIRHLIKRGITQQQVDRHHIGFAAVGKYAHRIIVPVIYRNEVKGFVTRTFARPPAVPKYLNSEGVKGLFNVPKKDEQKEKAILIEGMFDALSLERIFGEEYDCLGKLGATLTALQKKLLRKYKEIILWSDFDRAGILAVIDSAEELTAEFKDKTIKIVIPQGESKDADEMTDKEKRRTLKTQRLWSHTLEQRLRAKLVWKEG